MNNKSFYGRENADVSAINDNYPGIETPIQLYDALKNVWAVRGKCIALAEMSLWFSTLVIRMN